MAEDTVPKKKMGILKKGFIGFLVVLGVFAVIVSLQPADFTITRTGTMNAAVTDVFAQVNDFHKWEAWSPWAKLDPSMKQVYEGPASGVGAISSWSGNDKVGEGRMTLTESKAPELIRIKLDFIKPFEATNTTEFSFKQEGAQTSVKWSMSGHKNFVSKAMCLFMDMDKMVGGDFEKGLAQIKTVVETPAKK